MIVSMSPSVQKTLSILVWLPVLCNHSIGMNRGKAIFMLCHPSMFSNGWVSLRFSLVKRCAFRGSSHNGWWWLKSPIHMMCNGPVACCCLSQSCMNVDMCVSTLLLSLSLYTLIMPNMPNWPFTSTAVMSRWLKSICFHVSIRILVLMRMTDLVLSGCVLCVLG